MYGKMRYVLRFTLLFYLVPKTYLQRNTATPQQRSKCIIDNIICLHFSTVQKKLRPFDSNANHAPEKYNNCNSFTPWPRIR